MFQWHPFCFGNSPWRAPWCDWYIFICCRAYEAGGFAWLACVVVAREGVGRQLGLSHNEGTKRGLPPSRIFPLWWSNRNWNVSLFVLFLFQREQKINGSSILPSVCRWVVLWECASPTDTPWQMTTAPPTPTGSINAAPKHAPRCKLLSPLSSSPFASYTWSR